MPRSLWTEIRHQSPSLGHTIWQACFQPDNQPLSPPGGVQPFPARCLLGPIREGGVGLQGRPSVTGPPTAQGPFPPPIRGGQVRAHFPLVTGTKLNSLRCPQLSPSACLFLCLSPQIGHSISCDTGKGRASHAMCSTAKQKTKQSKEILPFKPIACI